METGCADCVTPTILPGEQPAMSVTHLNVKSYLKDRRKKNSTHSLFTYPCRTLLYTLIFTFYLTDSFTLVFAFDTRFLRFAML